MELRERLIVSTTLGGIWFRTSEPPGTVHPRPIVEDYRKSMLDYKGKEVRKSPDLLQGFLPPSDLEMRETWRVPSRMNRGGTGLILQSAVVDYDGDINVRSALYKPRGSLERQNENNLYGISLMARSNPFRTDYSIPVAIKELLDITSMFKLLGKTFLSFAGGAYLNIKFGWEQFLNDLGSIQRSVEFIARRTKEFESLGKHGGLRRKLRLDSRSVREETPNKIIQSTLGITGRAAVEFEGVIKVWGTIRWVPKASFRDVLANLDRRALAVKTLFGLNGVDAAQMWNMIPLSWIVDYFSAVADFFTALQGQDYIEPRDLCIMREYRHTERISPTTGWTSPLTVTKGKTTVVIKSRDVWVPANMPPLQVRLLSQTQLTNLGALVATFLAKMK